ncbi:hypothetical protein ACFV3E_24420 [Streptomyces sp. NPDC059718]
MATNSKAPRAQRQGTPIALIYDRLTLPGTTLLTERLRECERYASEFEWDFRGLWIEHGPQALTADDRPQLGALLHIMRAHSASRPVVCLVYDWDRLGSAESRPVLQRRVRMAGGWVETAQGESDRAVRFGHLHEAPQSLGAASAVSPPS